MKLHVVWVGFALALVLVGAGGFSQSIGAPNTPLKVAELLDCFVQNRFGQAEGRLGVSRMVTVQGHDRVRLFPETAFEKQLMGRIKEAHLPYVVSFLHVDRPPAISKDTVRNYPQYTAARRNASKPYLLPIGEDLMEPRPPARKMSEAEIRDFYGPLARRQKEQRREQQEIASKAVAQLPRLKRGEPVNLVHADWQVAMRPVRAKAACLSCHNRSKTGDTLGVMVNAVHSRARPLD